jgi:hypothetical protein
LKKALIKPLILMMSLFCVIANANPKMEDTTHTVIQSEEPTPFYFRATAGVGLPFSGIAYGRIDYGYLFISYRICGVTSLEREESEGPFKSTSDQCIIAGISLIKKQFYWSLGIGISKVKTIDPGSYYNPYATKLRTYYSIENKTWGFPIQIDLMFTPIKFVGLGFVGFGDFNSLRNFGGVAFCIQIGWLR